MGVDKFTSRARIVWRETDISVECPVSRFGVAYPGGSVGARAY